MYLEISLRRGACAGAAKRGGFANKKLGKEAIAILASTSLFALVLLDRDKWEEAEKLDVQVWRF